MAVAFRDRFPSLDDRVHFASCSYAPRSTFLADALDEMLRALDGERPWGVFEHKVVELRRVLSELLTCEERQVSLQPNATIAAFQVANSIDGSGRRIVASRAEFPSIVQVWKAQESRGAELVLVEHSADPAETLDAYRRVIDERVGLVSVPALDFVSGARLPVASITALARLHGATSFCDAYQLVGTEPLSMQALGVDYLAAGAMKYLLGVPGLAFLFAREPERVQRFSELTGWQARVDPFAFDPLRLDHPDSARRFETGTPAIAPVFAALAGVRALQEIGLHRVAERIASLKLSAARRFADHGLNLQWLAPPAHTGAHLALRMGDAARAKALERHLLNSRIQTSPRLDALRIAFHAFNRPEDVERLCESLVAARAAGLVPV